MKQKLFIVVNVDSFFLSHRLPIALAAQKKGYAVTILSKDTGCRNEIQSYGLRFIDIPFKRSSTQFHTEMKCIYSLYKVYKKEKPDIIHHVTIKACILGSMAASLCGIKKVINAISGFGYNFTEGRDGIKQKFIRNLMKFTFNKNSYHYIFQNPDDIKDFSQLSNVSKTNIHLIKGSGINLDIFRFRKEIPDDKVSFVFLARMLYDKGVVEFIEAAKKIKERIGNKAEFILAGDCDTENLAGISEKKLTQLLDDPYIRWIGFQKDVYRVLERSDVVVLPSYREGLPKTLIEACAMGRPIITTDTNGCRECVIDGINGYLVPVKDKDTLADKMEILINDPEKRKVMGIHSRRLAEKEFSIESVIQNHLFIYQI